MSIIRSSRLWCWLQHWSFLSWVVVGWKLGAVRLEYSYNLQPGHYSSLTAPNFQPTANQELNDQCGNQHYSRELLVMGIAVPETCWAYKKYNTTISGMKLVFILRLSQWCTVKQKSKTWKCSLSVSDFRIWLQICWCVSLLVSCERVFSLIRECNNAVACRALISENSSELR